jgi:hypothetical protein
MSNGKGYGSKRSWLILHLPGGNVEHHKTIQPIFCVDILNKIQYLHRRHKDIATLVSSCSDLTTLLKRSNDVIISTGSGGVLISEETVSDSHKVLF